MTFNFLSPEFPDGYSVSVIGKANSFKTTSTLRLALKQLSRITDGEWKTLTIFAPSSNIGKASLYKLAGFQSDEQFEEFKEEHNLAVVLMDRMQVPSLEVMSAVLGHIQSKDTGHHYVIIDDIADYPVDDESRLPEIRGIIAEASALIRGRVFVIGNVSMKVETIEGDGQEPLTKCYQVVQDIGVHFNSAVILLANRYSETPMVFVAKGTGSDIGRTMEIVDGCEKEVTDVSHPELARLGSVTTGIGIQRHLLPKDYIGLLTTDAMRSEDALEAIHQRMIAQLTS